MHSHRNVSIRKCNYCGNVLELSRARCSTAYAELGQHADKLPTLHIASTTISTDSRTSHNCRHFGIQYVRRRVEGRFGSQIKTIAQLVRVLAGELLSIHNLKTYFYTRQGIVKAIDGVSFDIRKGEIFGLVGESGCGKSVTALSIMRLVPDPPGKIVHGDILFEGKSLLNRDENEMRKVRGGKVSMIFQDPTASLNPVMKVGDQIVESLREHQELDRSRAKARAIEIMESVGIPNPSLRFLDYPFQFSGGMRQRIMIAIAISCSPSLLIADEATTNLDVTVQAQTLDLIKNISESIDISVLLITHNLGLVAWLCDRVAVMYSGKITESADTQTLFMNPRHPYTKALLECIPGLTDKERQLRVISGRVPNLIQVPPGCRFHPRCPFSMEICSKEEPQTIQVTPEHWVGCHLFDESSKKE